MFQPPRDQIHHTISTCGEDWSHMAALLFASRATTAFLATCYKHKSLKKSVKQSNGHPRCPLQSPTCVASLEKTSSLNFSHFVTVFSCHSQEMASMAHN